MLTIRNQTLSVLAIERAAPPFMGQLALPGGFVRPEEGLLEAARRELAEETSVSVDGGHLEQLATYGRPGPRSADAGGQRGVPRACGGSW